MSGHDVVVVGGGPAGCACALTLRGHAPGLSVALLEASDYTGVRLGETLPPPAVTPLRHLGVWQAFAAQEHRPAFGTVSLWGDAAPAETDFIFRADGVGWHLDRARFDAMLGEQCERRGVRVFRRTRLIGAERTREAWRLRLSAGELQARMVVDATGAAAAFARRLAGAESRVIDRLAGFVRFFREGQRADPRARVEAFAGGWWYTAGLPEGVRVVACMTDSDLGREMGLTDESGWLELLSGSAPGLAAMLASAAPAGALVVRAARSRRLDPALGDGWLAVGDAASSLDPLSSQGILKALRSGIFGGYAVGDLLGRGDRAGMRRYAAFVEREFTGYLAARRAHYAREQRWPGHEFWRRRQGRATVASTTGR